MISTKTTVDLLARLRRLRLRPRLKSLVLQVGNGIGKIRSHRLTRIAVAYVVSAWALIQVITTVTPLLLLPDWVARAVVIVIIVGFPLTLLVAWAATSEN